MKIRSRLEALKIRASLIVLGVGIGLLARLIFGVDSDRTAPVFEPIPTEFREQHSDSDLFEFLDDNDDLFDPFGNLDGG